MASELLILHAVCAPSHRSWRGPRRTRRYVDLLLSSSESPSPSKTSLRTLVAEEHKQRLGPYWCCVPFALVLLVAVIAWLLGPETIEDETSHHEWAGFFETSALVIGALIVGLVVEVRQPFARTGARVVRVATMGTAAVLAAAGLGAVVAMIPALPAWLYRALFGLTLGGLVGGVLAVMAIGISVSLASLDKVDRENEARLKQLGDR